MSSSHQSVNQFPSRSFGTVAKSQTMPDSTKKAFSEFPDITFLWKYEIEDGLAKDYPNVITDSWWPQTELLGTLSELVNLFEI